MNYDAQHIVVFPDPNVPGLPDAIRAAGHDYENHEGTTYATDGPAVQAIIDSFDAKPVALTQKLSSLADYRWQKEIGGIVYNGLKIETTDRSKTLVTGAMLMASQNPAATFQFKTTDDQYADVVASDMIGIYAAIGLHVQSCFAKEQTIANQIKALTTWQEIAAFDIDAAWSA